MHRRTNATKSGTNSTDHRAWYAFGLWLNVAIAGVGIAATGVAPLVEHTSARIPAIAWLLGGAALVAFAWRRARAALRRLEHAEAMTDRGTLAETPGLRKPTAGTAPVARLGLSAAAMLPE